MRYIFIYLENILWLKKGSSGSKNIAYAGRGVGVSSGNRQADA
jgi:hypothetical protein